MTKQKFFHAAIFTFLLTPSLAFANDPTTDMDQLTTNNNVSNESSQYSQGVVSNNPTYVNNGDFHAYGRIGQVSCAQASMNMGVTSTGEHFTNSGAVYLNVSIPLTSFGSGSTCESAMAEAKAQMAYDTAMVLTDHCLDLMAKGISYASTNQLSRKCQGFELTDLGKEMMEAQKQKLISDKLYAKARSNEAMANELEQQIRRHDLCKAAKERGMARTTFCQGIHIHSKDD